MHNNVNVATADKNKPRNSEIPLIFSSHHGFHCLLASAVYTTNTIPELDTSILMQHTHTYSLNLDLMPILFYRDGAT